MSSTTTPTPPPSPTKRVKPWLTVWWKSGRLSANFHWSEWALENQQIYEYRCGVPATIQYR